MIATAQKKTILIAGISLVIILIGVLIWYASPTVRDALFGEAIRGGSRAFSDQACIPAQWKYFVVGGAEQNPSTGRSESTFFSSDGTRWQRESMRAFSQRTLLDVAVSDVERAGRYIVWAVGDRVIHKKYSRWQGAMPDTHDSQVGSFTQNNFYAVWGDPTYDAVWIASGHQEGSAAPDGLLSHESNGGWRSYPTNGPAYGLWGTSRTDLWAVGEGFILHYAGQQWSPVIEDFSSALFAVWGTSPQKVWAVGESGTILSYDGVRWLPQASNTLKDLHALWGSSSSNVWAVGDEGTVLHYDGTSWAIQPVPSNLLPESLSLEDVFGSSARDVFVVGENGLLLHFDGRSWELQNAGTTVNLKAGVAVLQRSDSCGERSRCVTRRCVPQPVVD
ncbi:MAG: hypothetical protein Q8R53_04540 [Nanoarchaeota archaeon]|nr:hypothetical protein [Nanoarchaeota archaeon]